MAHARIGGIMALAAALGGFSLSTPAHALDRTDEHAVAAFVERATGQDVDPNWLCINAPAHFPDVTMIAALAPDAGCLWMGAIVHDQWLQDGEFAAAMPQLLADVGWRTADPATREQIALQWVTEVVFGGTALLEPSELPRRDDQPEFEPPTATSLPDGGVTVRVQVSVMTIAGVHHEQRSVTIAADGTFRGE